MLPNDVVSFEQLGPGLRNGTARSYTIDTIGGLTGDDSHYFVVNTKFE